MTQTCTPRAAHQYKTFILTAHVALRLPQEVEVTQTPCSIPGGGPCDSRQEVFVRVVMPWRLVRVASVVQVYHFFFGLALLLAEDFGLAGGLAFLPDLHPHALHILAPFQNDLGPA